MVGRQLHPAQAQAVARAEQAAARVEQVQAEVEARAARYAVAAEVEARAAWHAVPARTGGRQVRKQAVRRKAAAAGMDVLGWAEAQECSTKAGVRELIEQRLDEAREQWVRQQKGGEVGQRTFLQAAQAAGIEVAVPP